MRAFLLSCPGSLILAFAIPIASLLIAMPLAEFDLPTAAQRKAKYIAPLAVAAPPIFVFFGVVLFMLHSPNADTWFWVVAWTAACAVIAFADNKSPIKFTPAAAPGWLRVAHGASATASAAVIAFSRCSDSPRWARRDVPETNCPGKLYKDRTQSP